MMRRPTTRGLATLKRTIPAAVLAAVAFAAVTPGANAAEFGDFSPYVTPDVFYVDDCTAEVGPVFDSYSASYRKIGGVRVNCSTVHSVVKAMVWQQYWNGSAAVNVGSSNVGTRYNSTGSGYGRAGILRSGAVCGHAWFRTAALVQTERTGAYIYSRWVYASDGC